jgi:putative transposase
MIGCVRMTVRYCSRKPPDTELRERLKVLAHERRRFGYRRLLVLLRREGFIVKSQAAVSDLSRLMVRRRGGRKRALGTRAPMLVPQLPNDRWSIDFVADQFIDGRRMCILIVVDAHGSAWRSSPTPRSQAFGSLASSISYWPIAASRR